MTEEELQIAVESVRNSLTKSLLHWVLREVDETLRLGKPTVRTVIEVNEESPDVVHLPSASMSGKLQRRQGRRSTVIPTTEAYSKKEELGLLLDAIQRTAIATADMQLYVVAKIARRGEPAVPERWITLERDGRPSSTIPYENQAAAEVQIASLRTAVHLLKERAQ
jgi:hypothetical protein